MPRQPGWLDDLRSLVESGELSWGQLQSGTYHERVGRHKTGETTHYRYSPTGRRYATTTPVYAYPSQLAFNRGTGIPASVISRVFSGEFSPSQKTVSALRNFHRRFVYNELRSAGASKDEARRFRSSSDWYTKMSRYEHIVNATAERTGQPLNAVQWAYGQSQWGYEHWKDWGSPKIYDDQGNEDSDALEKAMEDFEIPENSPAYDPELDWDEWG